jgi:hypothetical protein
MKKEKNMKTRKQFLGLIAIAIIATAIIGCKEDEPDPPPPQEQPIDYITDNAGNQIPIYKTDGISDTDAVTAVNNIKRAYNSSSMQDYRDKFSNGVKKIYLLAGDSEALYSFDKATGILKVGSGWDWDIYAEYFRDLAISILSINSTKEQTPNA